MKRTLALLLIACTIFGIVGCTPDIPKTPDTSEDEIIEGIVHEGIIPEGCKYMVGDILFETVDGVVTLDIFDHTKTYEAGDEFPAITDDHSNHYYFHDNYIYEYNPSKNTSFILPDNTEAKGWEVMTVDKNKAEMADMITRINGVDVLSITATFRDCKNLIKAPALPENAKLMNSAFAYCPRLEEVGKIPNSIMTMDSAFSGCEALKTIGNFPSAVLDLDSTFDSCFELESVPAIPKSVKTMIGTFAWSGITGDIEINATPEEYQECFLAVSDINIVGECEIKEELLSTMDA